jgi:hypothetical protein
MSEKEFVEERVAFSADKDQPDKFLPRITVTKTDQRYGRVDKSFRNFEATDIGRVVDFPNVPDPPPDGPMMHCENGTQFPSRHFALRGGFLFYFDLGDVSGTGAQHYVTYHGPPLGCVPIQACRVEFPPGGRRVFREHAQTNARTGYELAILHTPSGDEPPRPPAFVVAESLGQRERWAGAIRARAELDDHTNLRAVASFAQDDPSVLLGSTKPSDLLKQAESKRSLNSGRGGGSSRTLNASSGGDGGRDGGKDGGGDRGGKRSGTRKGKRGSVPGKDGKGGDGEENMIQEALLEFGKNNFVEKTWIDTYFETHSEKDAAARCRQLEKWQESIKRGLKSAVLEQYEYFVEASGEMTKMGREVVDLKTLVETQVETVKEMKEIDFSSAILDPSDEPDDDGGDLFGGDRRKGIRRKKSNRQFGDDESDVSSVSSDGGSARNEARTAGTLSATLKTPIVEKVTIEIPSHLNDVDEEILAYMKESRYTDATDLCAKTKQEVSEIMQQHEKPTDEHLTKKQLNQMTILQERLDELAEMISNRLVENLRRKNEALKQASKRERSDPGAFMVPSVSPCCLNDDANSLQLLVKLGKSQEAATAYAARRSLLLLER